MRRLLWAAVLLGFVLRAGFGVIYWQHKPLTHDEREYLALAANVAAGRGFTHELPNEPAQPDVQRYGRAPVYPLFLAPIVAFNPDLRDGRMPDDVPDAVKIAQAVVGAIGVWLIGAIAARRTKPTTTAAHSTRCTTGVLRLAARRSVRRRDRRGKRRRRT